MGLYQQRWRKGGGMRMASLSASRALGIYVSLGNVLFYICYLGWNRGYVFCSGNFWCQEHQMKNISGWYKFIQMGLLILPERNMSGQFKTPPTDQSCNITITISGFPSSLNWNQGRSKEHLIQFIHKANVSMIRRIIWVVSVISRSRNFFLTFSSTFCSIWFTFNLGLRPMFTCSNCWLAVICFLWFSHQIIVIMVYVMYFESK